MRSTAERWPLTNPGKLLETSIALAEMNYARDNATDERLRQQISKMDTAREASERQSKTALDASITIFHTEQRAWVGILRLHGSAGP